MKKIDWLSWGLGILLVCCCLFCLLPYPTHGPGPSLRSSDKNNLKQIGLAFYNSLDEEGSFPLAKKHQSSELSWRVHILPYLDAEALYREFHLDEPWDSPHNLALVSKMPEVYKRRGSEVGEGKTAYLAVVGPGTIMENGGGQTLEDIPDEKGSTILVVSVEDSAAVIWTKPDDYHYDPNLPATQLNVFDDGFHALFADGSVRYLSVTNTPKTLLNLYRRNDGISPHRDELE